MRKIVLPALCFFFLLTMQSVAFTKAGRTDSLNQRIDCSGTKKQFSDNYVLAFAKTEPQYKIEISVILFLTWYVAHRNRGITNPYALKNSDPLGDSITIYYGFCRKQNGVSLKNQLELREGFKRAYTKFYQEFISIYEKTLRERIAKEQPFGKINRPPDKQPETRAKKQPAKQPGKKPEKQATKQPDNQADEQSLLERLRNSREMAKDLMQ